MYNRDYLAHYGKIGMRWGHRMHYKDARKEYEGLYNEEHKRESKTAKAMETKMLDYAKKHKLAYGSGNGTEKQWNTYGKMEDKHYFLEEEASYRSKISATKKFIEKFGEKDYRRMQTVDTMKVSGAVALMLGVPIIALGGISALLIKG